MTTAGYLLPERLALPELHRIPYRRRPGPGWVDGDARHGYMYKYLHASDDYTAYLNGFVLVWLHLREICLIGTTQK